MGQLFKLLFVEDIPTDVELILRELKRASISYEHKVVVDAEAFRNVLKEFKPDAVISDYSLPMFDAIEALMIKNQIAPNVPFVLVTGAQTEEVAAECIKKGADDYILKTSLTRIPTAIKNAINKKTAEKAKQEALLILQFNEEKYRNLFDNSLVGMFRAEGTTCLITEANKKTKEILGVSGIEGLSLKQIFKNEHEFTCFCQELKEHLSVKDLELKINNNKSVSWISLAARYYDKEDMIEGTIVDITSSKNNFFQLEKVNNELERFAYHASHDLKSPLKSVIGLILAIREDNKQPELTELIDLLEKSTERMDSLINDLLTMARLSRKELLPDPIDFAFEIPEIMESISFQDNAKKVKVSYKVNQKGEYVSDKARVCTVIRNLVENAIKYHTQKPDAFVEVEVSTDEKFAKVVVKDNGKGIEPVHQQKIFDMFYRASSSSDGSGLGLYIVKTTVDALNGKIELHTTLNKGTTFVITIPNQSKSVSLAKAAVS